MDKNPDVFDPEGFIVLSEGLDHSGDPKVIEASLDLALSAVFPGSAGAAGGARAAASGGTGAAHVKPSGRPA